MVVHIFEIFDRQVIFVVAIVFLENRSDQFFVFVAVWLSIHGFHEFDERNASSFLGVEFCDDFVGCLAVGDEAVLGEEEFDIVGEENSHTGGIVSIEDLFEVDDVLVGQTAGDVEFGFKLTQVFAFETDAVEIGTIDP
jgi:hypothetical protein